MSPSETGHIRSSLEDGSGEETPVVGHVLDDPTPALGLGQRRQPLRHRQAGDVGVGGVEEQRVDAAVKAVEDPDGAAGHLRVHGQPLGARPLEQPQHVAPDVGRLVRLVG
jgi:hypothetical protein